MRKKDAIIRKNVRLWQELSRNPTRSLSEVYTMYCRNAHPLRNKIKFPEKIRQLVIREQVRELRRNSVSTV